MRSLRGRLAPMLLTALVVGLAACGGNDTRSADESAATTARQSSGRLSFTGDLLGGGQLDGSSLAGQAVMLWFWAPT